MPYRSNLKRVFILSCCLLGLSLTTFSQGKERRVHFGLNAGASFMHLYGSKGNPWTLHTQASSWNFSGGGYFEIQIKKGFFARIEACAYARKISVEGTDASGNLGDLHLSSIFTQISVPLELGYYFFGWKRLFNMSLSLGASPMFTQSNNSPDVSIGIENTTLSLSPIALNLHGGLGVHVAFVSVLARFEYLATPVMTVNDHKFGQWGLNLLLRFNLF